MTASNDAERWKHWHDDGLLAALYARNGKDTPLRWRNDRLVTGTLVALVEAHIEAEVARGCRFVPLYEADLASMLQGVACAG